MHKYDLSSLSVIFSVKIDSQDRLNNLIWNIEYYESYFINYELVIVEQDNTSKLKKLIRNRLSIKHFLIPDPGAHYKTRNLNYATQLATREIVMMCDCDVFCTVNGLIDSLNEMQSGISFLSPHNGLLVELKKTFFKSKNSVSEVLKNLIYFPKDFNLNLNDYDFLDMAPLYGSSYYDSTGGCIFYRKDDFYRIGGWNTNIISYGFEDMEFVHRIKKLGFLLKMMDNYNIYHLEHDRLSDSTYNNYYRSNEAEWFNVSSMASKELQRYALNGFKKIIFNAEQEILLINTEQKYIIETLGIDKIDLHDLAIILPLSISNMAYLQSVNIFVNYMELYYKNYELIIVEGQFRNCKYLSNKKNTKYVWLGTQQFDINKAVEIGVSHTSKKLIGIWDFFTLINPIQFEKSVVSIRSNRRTRQLKDRNWYLKGIKKRKVGTGVILFENK